MVGRLRRDVGFRLVVILLWVISTLAAPACAALKSGTWQELNLSTDGVNGTVPMADGVTVPVYQGSVLLEPDKTHTVSFSAMPHDFSTDDTPGALNLVNPKDTEGDIFSVPPVRWQDSPPAITLIWADAATPDTPLSPQPVANQSFCMQNMVGKSYVIWPQLEGATNGTAPLLYLQTKTGTPFSNIVNVLENKIPVTISPAVGDPVTVMADSFNDTLKAARVKAGDSVMLTVTTHDCHGNAVGNTAFVMTRGDALNRQGVVNNSAPVHVGNTELTTTATEYRGVTDANGKATVVVTQANGPGVKTPLTIAPANAPSLQAHIDVIFTTLTSPDSASANMWGHMAESATADVEGETYTFSRPSLATETANKSGTVSANNESWAVFDWRGADSHCEILPDARQLMGLKIATGDLVTQLGWPVAGTNEYWSSSEGTLQQYHLGVNMLSRSVVDEPDSTTSLTSCVDKASPAITPELTLSLDNMDSASGAAKVRVGDSISMVIRVTDKATGQALPYRSFDLFIGDEQNRKGQNNAQATAQAAAYGWSDNPVLVGLQGSGTPNHYHAITGADGKLSVELTQDNGAGVLTPLRVVLSDGTTATANVIFTVVTSPDVAKARMWGHMQGVVEAGNIYKRPLLADEATSNTGSTIENHEDWATFNSVAAATAQCGSNQVPGQAILDALYAAHSANTMLTTFGWPTANYNYISADSDGSQTAHVNLVNGNDSFFSGTQPNYLTCSGNELVTRLEVALNGDENLKQATAKVGEKITMTIHSVNALNGLVVPNAAYTVTMAHGRNRSGLTTGFTDPTNGALTIDGEAYGPSQASMTYSGATDASGNATLTIEQPQGAGLLTILTLIPVNSLISTPLARSVKFTVPTSPDTPNAEMWGHMAETVTVDGLTFERPKLASEVTPTRTQLENNETWARVTHAVAAGSTAAGGCGVNRLPRADQLSALYNANSGGVMHSEQGWPVTNYYWSSTFSSATAWQTASLANGSITAQSDASVYTSCLTRDNASATSIVLEPVNHAQWSDTLKAAKVKKGEILQLKVTVKDADGNPLPDAPFVLSRGDGYTRQGTPHIAGSEDGIASAVVIDGESLNDTATKIGGLTGSDGSKVINVTRPETTGTKVAITAALYENASVSDTLETIFTVITSPDNDKAQMWGHMPETVTAASGEVFRRPQLIAEIGGGIDAGSSQENNEIWATADFDVVQHACGAGYAPTLADLQSLYSAWPGGAMNSQQGWPLDGKNYQNSTADLSRSTESRYVKSLNLRDNGITSQLWSEKLYFSCLKTAHPVATHLTLTSSAYKDSDGFAKAKVGETIPVVITTLDDDGKPVANTPVNLTRGDSVGRADQSINQTVAAAIQINHAETRNSGVAYYSATGDDGTLTLDISQDGGAGFKTPLRASLNDSTDAPQTLPVVFSVVTSPDTVKANYWGHMPETLTDSAGVVYKRPLLASEFSATPGKRVTLANGSYDQGETWGMVTSSYAWKGTNGGCGQALLPTLGNLQSLYQRYPSGQMRTANGWPVSNLSNAGASQYWWAGDYILNDSGTEPQYALVNLLLDGSVTATTSTSSYFMQTCLASARSLANKLTLTLAGQDEATGITKAKKGEEIAATVQVTDSLGQSVGNALVKITRGEALTRKGTAYTLNGADDITLSDIVPAEPATSILDSAEKSVFVRTDDSGRVTFNVSQLQTTGLKTVLTATLAENTALTDSKQAIFTVITSPDSDKATMWGHMPDTLTNSAGTQFKRPLLRSELSSTKGTTGYTLNNETWYTYSDNAFLKSSASPCDRMSNATLSDLTTLQSDYPQGALASEFGLPVTDSSPVWLAGNYAVSGNVLLNQNVNLFSGSVVKSTSSISGMQLCRVAPVALNIVLSSSKTLDTHKAGYVVPKGEKLPLTVSVTDDSGKPVAGVAFKFIRGTSYTRSSPSGEAIADVSSAATMTLVSTAPIATSKLMNANSSWYSMTGNNGQTDIELSQDVSTGLRTEVYAQLADSGVNSTAVDAIFTVLTSPDVDGAFRWGHMPETVAGPNGVTYLRPKLQSELPSDVGFYNRNNEYWAYPTALQAQTAGATGCDPAYQPLLSDLQALYNKYPNGEMETAFGWPLSSGKSWWAVDLSSTGQYQNLNLSTGTTTTTTLLSSTAMQTCRADEHAPLPATITLSSSAFDTTTQVAKVKKGETIPLTVTIKDTNGAPAANAAFTISRGDGVSRSGVVLTADSYGGTDDLELDELTPVATTMALSTKTVVFSGVTGADGTATFNLRQDEAMGQKTTITAKLTAYPLPTSGLDVIFTVITSPDSDKAQYWGHMPETATNSAGTVFRRPLLAAEMASNSGTYVYKNEIWPQVTSGNTDIAGATACDKAYQPLRSDMETLFIDNLSVPGGIGTTYGWPTGSDKPWWEADKNSSGNYQFITLSTGGSGTTSSTTAKAGQVCLVEPRSTVSAIMLTSTAMDTSKNAAVAHAGDTIPLTVTVNDSLGKPVANAKFTLSRSDSTNRAGVVITDGDVEAEMGTDDMILREQTPANSTVDMPTAASVFTGTTGADGTATFTLAQNKSLGLETTLTATLVDNTQISASLKNIFNVLTSPDTDKAAFWGRMPDTVTTNGVTLQRPLLVAELPSGVKPPLHVVLNKEDWAMAHTSDALTWDLAAQCGSLQNAAATEDLRSLYRIFSTTGWPSTPSYSYLSKTKGSRYYCAVNESNGTDNCNIDAAKTSGFASCVQ